MFKPSTPPPYYPSPLHPNSYMAIEIYSTTRECSMYQLPHNQGCELMQIKHCNMCQLFRRGHLVQFGPGADGSFVSKRTILLSQNHDIPTVDGKRASQVSTYGTFFKIASCPTWVWYGTCSKCHLVRVDQMQHRRPSLYRAVLNGCGCWQNCDCPDLTILQMF